MDGASSTAPPEVVAGQVSAIGPKLESLVGEVRAIGEELSAMRTELNDHMVQLGAEMKEHRELLERVLAAVGAGRNSRPVDLLEYAAFSELEVRSRKLKVTMSEEEIDQESASHDLGMLLDALDNLDAVRETTKPGTEGA